MSINRIIFFGTPEFSVPCLDVLIQNKKPVIMVVTQPDKRAGRGKKFTAPPIKKYCDEHGLPCIQPQSIKKNEVLDQIRDMKPDLMIVVAYGKIFPLTLLKIAPLTINVHASLLPAWRGASPISRSILNQDGMTGVSIMKIVEELDAGPVMLQKEMPIDADDDTFTLTGKLSKLGARALLESLNMIEKGKFEFVEQDQTRVTFAPPMSVEDAKIDWHKKAVEVHHHIRAYAPSPGAFTFDGIERIKIYKSRLAEKTEEKPGTLLRSKKQMMVACGDQWLEMIELQRPGKTRQNITDFLNGYPMERKRWNDFLDTKN